MNSNVRAFLSNLEEQGRSHDLSGAPHQRRYLNLEPDTAEIVTLLIRIASSKHVLEVGTSNGVSAIWIADALSITGGHLTLIERDTQKHQEAALNLSAVHLDSRVKLLLGDATEIIRSLLGPYDCVFFDADRVSAPEQTDLLIPKLSRPALLLADNALSHREEIAPYIAKVSNLPDAYSHILPVGKGLSVTYMSL